MVLSLNLSFFRHVDFVQRQNPLKRSAKNFSRLSREKTMLFRLARTAKRYNLRIKFCREPELISTLAKSAFLKNLNN